MKLGDLRDVFRREMIDQAGAKLWQDEELDEFANDAVMEADRRGYLIIDSTTAAICQLAYTANNPVLPLDPRVIAIRTAIVRGQIIPLMLATAAWMDRIYPGWRSTTATYPTILVKDWGSGVVRAYPNPTASGIVDLSVCREPLNKMVSTDDVPEIPARYHRSLVHWMVHRAYSKRDTETEDQDEATKAEGRFAAEFGPRRSALEEKWQAEQAGQTWDTLA